MGYIEGNLSAIDYSYGGTAPHYPLWKPPSGYFPRGEAPPPYEEAVAISQAEALSAQCTVTLPSAINTQRAVSSCSQQQLLQQHALQVHTQPQQHHMYSQQLAPTASAQNQQAHASANSTLPQTNQYTQSTTNLINININSGGITTIATGENHQPPYSLQNDPQVSLEPITINNSAICPQSLGITSTATARPLTVATMASNGRSANLTECNYKNCHLNISASLTTAAANNAIGFPVARRLPRANEESQQQQYLTVADVEINASASSYHSLQPLIGAQNSTEFDIIATTSPHHKQQLNVPAQALTTGGSGMLPSLEIATNSSSSGATDPISEIGHRTLPLHSSLKVQQLDSTKVSPASTGTTSRRFQRTVPRYFAVADPQQINTNANGSGSLKPKNSNDAVKVTKKPMCQCPIQHVPMSYMGSNVSSTTFNLNGGSGKLFTNASSSASALSPGTRQPTLAYGHRAKSSSNMQYDTAEPPTLKRSAANISCTASTEDTTYRTYEPKITTISKQVGDELNYQHNVVSVPGIIPPPPLQHHDVVSAPLVLGRVQKRSSGTNSNTDRMRCSSSGNARIGTSTSTSTDAISKNYINRKVDDPLCLTQKQQQNFNNQQTQQLQSLHQEQNKSNPTLPPKLHKSLSNLKTTSSTIPATTTAYISTKNKSSNSSTSISSGNNSVQTIYSLSKRQSVRKEQHDMTRNLTPSLTLPSTSFANNASDKTIGGKINSSTFYPLVSNHVTYTLPKHIGGKMSLNSTINSVVSKVPSVVSLPAGTEKINAHNSVTLPKILRMKIADAERETTKNLKIASCQMPDYPLNNNRNDSDAKKSVKSATTGLSEDDLSVSTTSKIGLSPNELSLPNDASLDDDYLSECENCKIAQSVKYYLNTELSGVPSQQETMTLQRKASEEIHDNYYHSSHTLPNNVKRHGAIKNNNRDSWQFSTIPATSSSDEDFNE